MMRRAVAHVSGSTKKVLKIPLTMFILTPVNAKKTKIIFRAAKNIGTPHFRVPVGI